MSVKPVSRRTNIGDDTKIPHSPYTTLGIAASSSMVILSRSSMRSGIVAHHRFSARPKNLFTASSPDDKKRSLRKIAIAMPNAAPIANPRTEL